LIVDDFLNSFTSLILCRPMLYQSVNYRSSDPITQRLAAKIAINCKTWKPRYKIVDLCRFDV
jgi:hypothetical protein